MAATVRSPDGSEWKVSVRRVDWPVGPLALFGALFEFGGILLIAAPDVLPGARRFGLWLDRRWRSVEDGIRRWLRLRPRVRGHRDEGQDRPRPQG